MSESFTIILNNFILSAKTMENNRGPKIKPCGTPDVAIYYVSERCSQIFTCMVTDTISCKLI